MAFEFRDILPAVGAVIGFGFGGPGGAALGSGIGSLARGDEAMRQLKCSIRFCRWQGSSIFRWHTYR